MGKSKETSKAIDHILFGVAIGSITGTVLLAPNAGPMLEKPLEYLFKNLDERQKRRELSKLRSYMKTQGLVRGDYEHGITITKKGKERIAKYEFNHLAVPTPQSWNGGWSLVMFDIPEEKRDRRVGLVSKLEEMGFQLLQQSAWVHPFPCKEQIYTAVKFLGVHEWVTYIETTHIDNSEALERRFQKVLSGCR